MTKEELAKFLGIDTKHIRWDENNPQLFEVFNANIRRINSNIWEKDLSLEFWRCNFETNVVFPSKTNDEKIYTQITFQDCVFHSLVDARSSVFEKEFKCNSCILEDKVDFSGAEFKQKASFEASRFKNEARFIETQFQAPATESETIENNFRETQFEGKTSFASSVFEGRVDFGISRFKNEARFIKTQFQAPATESKTIENNFRETQFEGKTSFDSSVFEGRVNFGISRFKNEARFIKTQFQAPATESKTIENNFREIQFEGKVFFSGTEFEGRVDFKRTEFGGGNFMYMKIESEIVFLRNIFQDFLFENIVFEKKVKFDKCTFRKTLFVNENEDIKSMFHEVEFQNCIFKETNTFRDRVFSVKPLLTTNTFDGQFNIDQSLLRYDYADIDEKNPSIWRDLFRRLKSNRLAYHNIIDASELHTQELYARELELKKEAKTIKEKVERWQLCFFHITSDHHTDLALIFNNVVVLIALFGFFASILLCLAPSPEPSIMRFVQENGGVLSIFDLEALSLQSKSPKIERQTQWFYSLIACIGFVGIYLGLITATNWLRGIRKKWSKVCLYGFYIFVYCASFALLFYKPPLLLPIIGKFFDESLKLNFAPLQSLCIVYYILMILMFFSLQKTARKNSIVPS